MAGRGNQPIVDICDHVVLGHFSVDENGGYCNDDRNRKFFVRPDDEPNFDLKDGLDDFVDIPTKEEPASMVSLLKWMKDHQDTLQDNGLLVKIPGTSRRRLAVDIVARRGVLAELLRAAFSVKRVDIFVTLYQGTLFIEGNAKCQPETPESRKFAFIGHKFKQFVTSVDGYEPDTFLAVNAREAYYAMVKVKCGGETLLLSSDIQAERQESSDTPPRNYVAVKTRKAGPHFAWSKKLQWWSQCYLTGIPQIVCGCRGDKDHVVHQIEYYATEDLVSDDQTSFSWTPEKCIQKIVSLLQDIREKVTDDDPSSVYHLVLEEVEKGRGQTHRLNQRTFDVKGKLADDYTIVKDWFIAEVLQGEE